MSPSVNIGHCYQRLHVILYHKIWSNWPPRTAFCPQSSWAYHSPNCEDDDEDAEDVDDDDAQYDCDVTGDVKGDDEFFFTLSKATSPFTTMRTCPLTWMDGDEDGDNDDVEENDDNNDDENDDNDEDGGNGDENDADWLTALTDEQIWIQSSITGLPNLVLGKI